MVHVLKKNRRLKPKDHLQGGTEMKMESEWRCIRCGKRLGIVRQGRLHLRFSRGYDYLVGFPATGACYGCNALNEIRGPTKEKKKSVRSHG